MFALKLHDTVQFDDIVSSAALASDVIDFGDGLSWDGRTLGAWRAGGLEGSGGRAIPSPAVRTSWFNFRPADSVLSSSIDADHRLAPTHSMALATRPRMTMRRILPRSA